MHDLDYRNYIATYYCSVRAYKTAINQVKLIQLDPSDDAPRFRRGFSFALLGLVLCHAVVGLIIAL